MNLVQLTEQQLWIGVAIIASIVVALGLWFWLADERKPKPELMICPNCGCFNRPKLVVPGSNLMVFLLILIFVVPAIFYILFREMATRRECPVCGRQGMVPHESPRGRKLQKEFHINER